MTPLDTKNLARLVSTLEEIERANTVAQLHIGAARASIGHALRIAPEPARDYVPDAEEAGT